jgi:magnesium-transporting ATPase (P-type)
MNWFQTEKEKVLDELESSRKGISDEESVKRKTIYGPNTDNSNTEKSGVG